MPLSWPWPRPLRPPTAAPRLRLPLPPPPAPPRLLRPPPPPPATAAAPAASPAATEKKIVFDKPEAIAEWKITGDVKVDTEKKREGSPGSLKIAPGGKATYMLRDSDCSGKVEIWVFDDMTKQADPKATMAGPRWGLLQKDGHAFTVGILYARFLGGDTTYATSDSPQQKLWFTSQWLALNRKEGWNKWTFDFDADKGLAILFNDVNVNAKKERFIWDKTTMKAFAGLIVVGDAAKENQQTFWVSDITATLGGPMKIEPKGPPPAAPKPAASAASTAAPAATAAPAPAPAPAK